MKDFSNEVKLTGIINRLRQVTSKRTRKPMAEVFLSAGGETIRCMLPGTIGRRILADCLSGDQLQVSGKLTIQRQQDPATGLWLNNHAIKVWSAEKL